MPRPRARPSPRWRPTLAGQFLGLQLSVLVVVLLCAGFVTLQQADSAFRDERGSRLRSAAESLAGTGGVRVGLQAEYPSEVALASYAEDVRARLGADAVSLADADADAVTVVGPDPADVGSRLDLGDDSVLEGRAWVGDIELRGERALAVAVPVLADDGEVIGAVLIAQAYPSLSARAERAVPDLLVILGLGLALGGLGSWGLSRLIRRRTRGLEPAEIGALADQREALLHSLGEGLIAVTDDGRLTLVNDAARTLVPNANLQPGIAVAAAGLPDELSELLHPDERQVHGAVLAIDGRVLVVDRRRVRGGGTTGGVVVTLRDHTELLALRSELRDRESVTETLRAQTHEFANQLHTVSGLLQLQEYDEAAAAIGTIVRRRAEISDGVRARVEDPQVAALLVAKTSVAAERGLRVEVVNTAPLPRLDPDLASDVVTVLGNLVDNAVDAISAAEGGDEVRVGLAGDAEVVTVSVADNGPGISPDDRHVIFERGWSTKPATPGGRGIGLALVRQVCQRRGGDVEVRAAADGHGTVFLARIPVQGADRESLRSGRATRGESGR